jgi:hypothetical protein
MSCLTTKCLAELLVAVLSLPAVPPCLAAGHAVGAEENECTSRVVGASHLCLLMFSFHSFSGLFVTIQYTNGRTLKYNRNLFSRLHS